jgi:hypothetical protein
LEPGAVTMAGRSRRPGMEAAVTTLRSSHIDRSEIFAQPVSRSWYPPRERLIALTLAVVKELSGAELDELIAEATVDCYGEEEQLTELATMIADNLAVPFETTVLGLTVTVPAIDQADSGIVAICVRGKHRQAISVLDLPLPDPPPPGAEWITAYRRWAR